MGKIYKGDLIADEMRFAIICSRFNEFITNKLLEGAIDALIRHKAKEENIDVIWTPGSFEIPIVANKIAKTKKYDAIICLGAIIRGETPHFEYVASEVSKGISKIGLETLIPVIFGVLTVDTLDQAIGRSGTKYGNKGWSAALSAIEMVDLMKKI
ncbi:MAG: 6,7-dimethyl-8-ribityllumazine synthase [bacterium]